MNFQKIKRKYIYIYFNFISLFYHPSIPFYYSIIINLEYNKYIYIYIIINDMIYCDCRMIKKILL